MRIKVEVTPNDIRRGIWGDSYRCPIAKALRRTLGGAWSVRDEAVGLGKNTGQTIALPKKALSFIDKYDRWRTAQPFSFSITRKAVK